MADEISIVVNAVDNFSGVLGNFGSVMTGIKSTIDLVSGAFENIANFTEQFVNSASESENALAGLDAVLASTAPTAGVFSDIIGQLSKTQLVDLHDQFNRAKDRLGELKEQMQSSANPTEELTLRFEAQREKVNNLANQLKIGSDGLVVYRDTTQLSRDALIDLSQALQQTTKYSDEQVISAEAMLLRYENINKNIFPQAIQLTTDLAQSLGLDLTSAARMVGMALDDPAAGIGRLNTQFRIFDDSQMEVIKHMAETGDLAGAQALIMQGLTEKVGGAAEAFGETFTGKLSIARNMIDDFKEAIGGPIIEILKIFFDQFINFSQSPTIQTIESFFNRFRDLIAEGNPIIASLGATFLNFESVNPIFAELGNWLLLLQGYLNSGNNPFDAIRKSIDDLLFAHPDGPLTPILKSIQDFISTGQTEGWGAAIGGLFSKVWDGLGIPDMIQKMYDWVVAKFNAIDWTQISTGIQNFINSIALKLGDPGVQKNLGDVVGGIIKTAVELAIATIDFAGKLTLAISGENWEPLGNALKSMFLQVIGGALLGGAAGITQSTIDQVADNIAWLFAGIKYKWNQLGQDMADGIKSGFSGSYSKMVDAARTFWDDFIGYVKMILGISSPSTVFAEIGKSLIDGVIKGWNDATASLLSTVGNTIEDIGRLFGIDLSSILGQSAGGLGTASGGTAGGTAGGGTGTGTSSSTTGQTVNNYFYGPVYFNQGTDNTDYDCISPNPLMTSGSGTPVFTPI